ncbi:phosphoenolpyruvate--protein phosphotransferase [Sphingomonas koreensis]|nr:phosphoenolpyruvate--protein phosphotransferase [Sphingomonas koreensis]
MAELVIHSPLRGWSAPLEEVPDPVFATRMLGDGVAIHPIGSTLHAPCAGTIATLHHAHHAVTIRSDAGADILLHLGLETVALAGRGFTPRVVLGQRVAAGDALIDFDLDAVALKAASMITPVIVTNGDAFAITQRAIGRAVEVGDPLMTLTPVRGDLLAVADRGEAVASRAIAVPMAHGIHARPAARIADCARGFEATIEIVYGDRRGNARSPIALLALGVRVGDRLTIEAQGKDAEAAIEAVGDLILGGMDEAAASSEDAVAASEHRASAIDDHGHLAGIVASRGVAIGAAVRMTDQEIAVEQTGAAPAVERAALAQALDEVRAALTVAAGNGVGQQSAIMAAHRALLDDPMLGDAAESHIGEGFSAGFAWRRAIRSQAALLEQTGDPRLVERADDLLDLERQVLIALGAEQPPEQIVPPGSILLARDLLPSQLIALDPSRVAGLCLERGGPTSHVAILAAGMELPMLVALGAALGDVADGAPVILDAEAGLLQVDPDAATLEQTRQRIATRDARRAAARATALDQARTADGTRIEVFANLGSLDDARLAVAHGAEGSGLLRTEFLFLDRDAPPGEDEQAAQYQAIADVLAGRPLIVRLLDIGGDKPARYLPMPAEDNPALGLRGIRIGLDRPELLETQIRAILRVEPAGQCRIMAPMVASVAELRAVRAIVDRAAHDLKVAAPVALGVMIETPAAAVTADLIAAEADFLSIGTNDLTQYTLAMDRGNAAVAAGVDALHPAVLRLIAQTCRGAATHDRVVGVCGGLASDPAGIPLLIGLGITELSTIPAFVPEAKALVSRLDVSDCREHAAHALACRSAAEVRALCRTFEETLS